MTGLTFQEIMMRLDAYWAAQGCLITQPYDVEVGTPQRRQRDVRDMVAVRVRGERGHPVPFEPVPQPADGAVRAPVEEQADGEGRHATSVRTTGPNDGCPRAGSGCIVGRVAGRGCQMHANVGDHLVVESRTVDQPRREGEILEVHGEQGAPPYLVRWADGHEGLSFPGPDAHIAPAH